ncbi:MAG TPA: hypothetical protein VNA20_16920 [Frankiaceae bacterium]|nr:hypothetical protein [Frankiaceae bacterium]
MATTPDDAVRRITGREPVAWRAMDEGAYSPSGRWVVRFADGGSAFVKAEPRAYDGYGVAVEHLVYATVSLPCLPRLVGYDTGPPLVLVTEDLSNARWGTPVTDADAITLRDATDAVAAVEPPAALPPLEDERRWPAYVTDPAPFVATGLAGERWARAHLPALADAEAAADARGDRLVHGDVWLQNWCRAGRGLVIVDWAGARRADPLTMYAGGEAAVRAAGGPHGLVLQGRPEWAAWAAGLAAYHLTRADPAEERLTETLRREALATLRWACDELGLPPADSGARLTALGPWRP